MISVLYSDQHIVVVEKPARIPVASEASQDETLLEQVRAWNVSRQKEGKKGYCVPIHFLDRPVSGVVVFAISSKAASRLNEQFRSRKVTKTYYALCEAAPARRADRLIHWLAKDPDDNKTFVVSEGHKDGKRCELSYDVIETHGKMALLEVKPVTGRSHQIRVQLSSIGAVIYGDVKYGSTFPWEGRIALHAYELSFEHPVTKEKVTFRARIPDYWRALGPLGPLNEKDV